MPGIDCRARASCPAGGDEQQVLEIVAKDLDRLLVGALLQLQPHLGLNGGIQQAV